MAKHIEQQNQKKQSIKDETIKTTNDVARKT